MTPKYLKSKIDGDGQYDGSLDLRGYHHPLPSVLRSVKGSLTLEDYSYPLPDGLTRVGGNLFVGEYRHPLPAALKSVGRDIDLYGYKHPLPARLKSVGGNVDLLGYKHALPDGLTSVGNSIFGLDKHRHSLPSGLTSVGSLRLKGYKHALPSGLKSVGGSLDLHGYKLPLPGTLKSVWRLNIGDYAHPMPDGLEIGAVVHAGKDDIKRLSNFNWKEQYSIRTPRSPEFQAWFDGSHVATPEGKPVVAYHATSQGGFSAFRHVINAEQKTPVFWFTSDLGQAVTYLPSEERREAPRDPTPKPGEQETASRSGVYRAWLQIKNPYVLDAQGAWFNTVRSPEYPRLRHVRRIAAAAYRDGYDGVIFHNLRAPLDRGMHDEPADVYAVFEPTQIKSALFNRGTYDPKDPDIRKNPRRRTSRGSRRKTSRMSRRRG